MQQEEFAERPYGFNGTARLVVPEAEEILYKPFKCLDNGFVRLIDYMGSDTSVVQAARISYGAGTKRISDDRALIRYLMRHRHTTPFEMVELKFHVRVPMDCWRQWIRHRTANVNEYSTRYSIAIDEAQKTPSNKWRLQSEANKQGSIGFLDEKIGEELSKEEEELIRRAREVYEKRVQMNVAREQARKDLPLSTYTEAYWKIDLHNLFNFLSLRMNSHAQAEIREYANTIGEQIVRKVAPICYEAFLDFKFNSITFSSLELVALRKILNQKQNIREVVAEVFSNKREGEEFIAKFNNLYSQSASQ